MVDSGLTEAEILAITTFTAADYLYLNPAVANSPSWMAAQTSAIQARSGGPVDTKKLVEGGTLHAGVMMQGVAKLKVMKGTVYRGARMNQKEFDAQYGTKS